MRDTFEIIEELIECYKNEIQSSFKKSEFIKWLSNLGIEGDEVEKVFSKFRALAESAQPQISLKNGISAKISSLGSKKGRQYRIELSAQVLNIRHPNSSPAKPFNDLSVSIPTSKIIDDFLQTNDMAIGGSVINSNSLTIIRNPEDLGWIPNGQEGCYFIFCTLPETHIPCFSESGYLGYKREIIKDGKAFRCLYNGKGEKTKERLMNHIFSKATISKASAPGAGHVRISDTGAMSLEAIDEDQVKHLQLYNQFDPGRLRLKKVSKAVQLCSHVRYSGKVYLLNGIDIREPQWAEATWAVCVVRTDSEFGKILIEEAFARENGRPPLCRRHG